jgi:hypothetical protein
LFSANFYVCGETNAAKCLVTNQIAFYAAGPTKKLSLKRSFYAVVFSCFLTKFCKNSNPICFYVLKTLLKKIKKILFFSLLQINIFLVFSDHFDALISKIIFLNKKCYFNTFPSKKHFEKQSQSHFQKQLPQIFYTCFSLHINFNHNFYQTHI